ncbi:transient receptor potential cation channel subfamily A member 1-like [Oratosquilla oratoria]|uniref:transient receptor potential cation channel subfamily A member 1-like n=1 Tax=Oratosquilla oratoria TaxID=337810 RepID=UPI003F767E74
MELCHWMQVRVLWLTPVIRVQAGGPAFSGPWTAIGPEDHLPQHLPTNKVRFRYDDLLLDAVDRDSLSSCVSILKDYRENEQSYLRNETTPLTLAAQKGNPQIIKLLLSHGFSVNGIDINLQTALHIAAEKGNVASCSELLESDDIKLNMRDYHGNTPLHLAGKQGNAEICQRLLNKNIKIIDIGNNKKFTALHFAVKEGNYKVARLLLNRGSNREAVNKEKRIPLHYAAERGCTESSRFLLEEVAVKQLKTQESNGLTPLMLAARQGHHRCCVLMKNVNTISIQDNYGNTALHFAFRREFHRTAEVLFSVGADANVYNNKKYTPLLEAASNKSPDCIRLGTEKGGDLRLKNRKGQNALHLAARRGSEETLFFLLEQDIMQQMVNDQDENGLTPLHHAITNESTECCIALCQKGASGSLPSTELTTPLHLAANTGNASVCKQILYEKRILASPEDGNQNTPLHLAAAQGSVECCRLLLRKHARVSAKNAKGQIPIHLAAEKDHKDCVELLARNTGTTQKTTDEEDRTVLHVAAASGALGSCKVLVHICQSLLWTTAKTDTLPLDFAFEGKHDDVYRFLLQNMPLKRIQNLVIKKRREALEVRLHRHLKEALHRKRLIVIQALVESSWWKYAVTDKQRPSKNFIYLVEKYPQHAQTILDKCNTLDERALGLSLLTNFHSTPPGRYSLCLPDKHKESNYPNQESGNLSEDVCFRYTSDQAWFEEHPLVNMVVNKRLDLLKHPVTEVWILNQWLRFAVGFYIYLAFELLFVVLLSVLALITSNWEKNILGREIICGFPTCYNVSDFGCTRNVDESAILSCGKRMSSPHYSAGPEFVNETVLCSDVVPRWSPRVICVSVCLAVILVIVIVTEIYFLMRFGRWYWRHWWLPKFLRIVTTLTFITPWTLCCLRTGIREDFQWISGIVAVLLGWFIFIKALLRLPLLSFILPITWDFMKSYLRLLLCISAVILLSAFTFHLLLWNQKAFENIPQAMVKTVVLMLGDYGYDDMFLGDDSVAYPVTTNIFFMVFIITIGSFIVNLIIMKPNDLMENFRQRAFFDRVASRAQWVLILEMCVPKFLALDPPDDGSSKNWLQKLNLSLWSQEDQEGSKYLSEGSADCKQSLLDLCDRMDKLKDQIDELKEELSATRRATGNLPLPRAILTE